jgi:aminoglycoside phosphotransferase (APT) family kinase protein
MDNEFLRQRHALYATPRDVINDVVKRATGHDVAEHEQLMRGYDNEVYRVWTKQGERFIVRVNQHGNVGFREEAWAMERCRAEGVPVPDVYGIETVTIADQNHDVMVVQHAPGRSLHEVEASLTEWERARVWSNVGATLSAIHRVKVDGFYLMHADGSWDFPDWDSIMRSAMESRAADVPDLLRAGLPEAEAEQLLAILAVMPTLPAPQPVLCHGDLRAEHVFVDDQLRVCSVIDWGYFQGGPALLDVATLRIFHSDVPTRWIMAGYGDKSLCDASFPVRLLLQLASLQMGFLAHEVREGNRRKTEAFLTGIRATIAEWAALER